MIALAAAFAYLAGVWRMSVLARRHGRHFRMDVAEALRVIGLVIAWPLLVAMVAVLFGAVGVFRLFRDAEVV